MHVALITPRKRSWVIPAIMLSLAIVPLIGAMSVYMAWGAAWLELGHVPSMADNTHGWLADVTFVISDICFPAAAFGAPLALVMWLILLIMSMDRDDPRMGSAAIICVVTWIGFLLIIHFDPGGAFTWWID